MATDCARIEALPHVTRRQFVMALGAGAALAGLAPGGAWARAQDLPLGAWMRKVPGQVPVYGAGRIGSAGVRLPERAHQIALDPRDPGLAYVAARRPGEWLWRIDLSRGRVQAAFAQDDSRRFEGHVLPLAGARPGDDRLLTTESNADDGAGLLVLRDARTLAPLVEWATHGIGPHEAVSWTSNLVVVANGGVLTLPETGRERRNDGPIESSIATLDAASGMLRDQWQAPAPGLSLRHLAVAGDGSLGVAMQAMPEAGTASPAASTAPLLVILPSATSSRWQAAEADAALLGRLRGYAGAIAACGDAFAVSCPHGDRVVIWSSGGRLLAECSVPGACGLAADSQGWWVSSESGDLYRIAASDHAVTRRLHARGMAWDNHLG